VGRLVHAALLSKTQRAMIRSNCSSGLAALPSFAVAKTLFRNDFLAPAVVLHGICIGDAPFNFIFSWHHFPL
jgi:hypothetical protein